MNEVKCTIPADMLRYTASALSELAIRKRMAADGFPVINGRIDPAAAELLKQAAEVQKAADFWTDWYMQQAEG